MIAKGYTWIGLILALSGISMSTQAQSQIEYNPFLDSMRSAYDSLNGEAYWKALIESQVDVYLENTDQAYALIEYVDRALDSTQHPYLFGYHHWIKGQILENEGERVAAIRAYLVYLESREALALPQEIGQAYNALGNLFESLGMEITALTYFEGGLSQLDSTAETGTFGFLLNNIGEIYFDRKEYEKALSYYQRAYKLLEQESDALKVVPLHNLGRIQGVMGEYAGALNKLKEAYRLDQGLGDIEGMALDNMEIGKVYLSTHRYDSAEYHLRNALQQGARIRSELVLIEVLPELASLYQELDAYVEALRFQTEYRQLTDSMLAKQHITEIQALESAYQQRQQAQEIIQLRRANSLEEMRLRETNLQALSFIVTFLLVLIVLGVILWQYRTNAKASTMLNESNQKLEESNLALESINKQLATSQQNLQEVNATKDKFFSIISHDLKSPLNSLMGLLNLLLKYGEALSQDERQELTIKIDRSVKSLTNLLDNLLKWSMAQTNTMDYNPKVIDLRTEVERTAKLLALSAEQKAISVEREYGAETMIYADQDMANFILRNLLTNAIKFTHHGGEVRLKVTSKDNRILLTVEDNGLGISKDHLEKLFRIDANISTKGTANEVGTGLGLLLIKEFVEKNEGTISVASVEGKGTVFTVSFPLLDLSEPEEEL